MNSNLVNPNGSANSSDSVHLDVHLDDSVDPDSMGARSPGRRPWRVVDIVVGAVLGVACGLIFFGWNTVGYAGFMAMDSLTPGLGGLASGVWFLGGTLGMLVIGKPGAAVFVELVAGMVSALIGNVWGISTLYSALAQGLGAEIVFAMFALHSFKLRNHQTVNFKMPVAMLAGAGAGLGAWTLELFLSPNWPKGVVFNAIYLASNTISGAILAGAGGAVLVTMLAKTGVLSQFASGRASLHDHRK